MPLNDNLLQQGIYAAFKRQSVKGVTSKANTDRELARDLARAISVYVRLGTVQTAVTSFGIGATAPHPMVIPVFTVATGTGIGFVV
jgi:hypothetical protein|tara:strand:- start:367 stop:624 length:258 start_codon:yes stop_codon:yes gene_type:complete